MGGWVAILGAVPDLEERLEHFRCVFAADNVPPLKLEVKLIPPQLTVIGWAWNRDGVPDVHVARGERGRALVLCGVVTASGGAFPFLSDQKMCAQAILENWKGGTDASVGRLNGSFSCLFYDPSRPEITLFSDRFASQPVWRIRDGHAWLAGNYPSAVAACMGQPPRIDLGGLWSLLHYGRHVGTHGLFQGMGCLRAGEKAVLAAEGGITTSAWWQRQYRPEIGVGPEEWGQRIAESLSSSAARYRKVSAAPFLFLSGGLDSRIAAAAMGPPLDTVTLCTKPNAESRIAAKVSSTLGLAHRTIERSPYWYLDTKDAAALVSSGIHLTHHCHFIVPSREILAVEPRAAFFLGDLLENFNKHYFTPIRGEQTSFDPKRLEQTLFQLIPSTVKHRERWGIHLKGEIRSDAQEEFSRALIEHAHWVSSVSSNPADQLDTLLRWADVSATYTFNMLTCIRALGCERNLCFDNDMDDLSLAIPAELRGRGILHRHVLSRFDRNLLAVPDANFLLPVWAPAWTRCTAKKLRPVLGRLRRHMRNPGGAKIVLDTSGSWLLRHEMIRKDPKYKGEAEELVSFMESKLGQWFSSDPIRSTWSRFLEGEISLNFELEALFSLARLAKRLNFR